MTTRRSRRTAWWRCGQTTRARRSAKSGGSIHEQVTRAPDVPFVGGEMRDGHAQRDAFAQPRVREKHIARLIDEIEQPLVGSIERGFRKPFAANRIPAEADDAQRDWREPFEIRMRVHPRREELRETDMLGEARADGLCAERPQDHPELERS